MLINWASTRIKETIIKTKDFYFELPGDLIAQVPSEKRGESRLLVVDRKKSSLTDSYVKDLHHFLPAKSHLVFNNSKVRKARVFGSGAGGGNVEVVFIRDYPEAPLKKWLVMLKKSGSKAKGTQIILPGNIGAMIVGRVDASFIVEVLEPLNPQYFEKYGHIPLPPYISRADTLVDEDRYQTVYAKEVGSAAAPTAGLHFTKEILDRLEASGFRRHEVSLHVGLGTFSPVQVANIADHHMHEEFYEIGEDVFKELTTAKKAMEPVCAIGTTSLRTLESAKLNSGEPLLSGPTRAFFYPGYSFGFVDHLFTNFHTPESTLFMLVCAFMGFDFAHEAYAYAIDKKYRFFSYGDAMLIL